MSIPLSWPRPVGDRSHVSSQRLPDDASRLRSTLSLSQQERGVSCSESSSGRPFLRFSVSNVRIPASRDLRHTACTDAGMTKATCAVDRALERLARGEPVVVMDDTHRENEGDLIVAAEMATPATVAFLVRHTSGVLCVALPPERCEALALPLMVGGTRDAQGTAFTVSVDARRGTTTGVSAADRSLTIRALARADARADDFARPGHVFPLLARPRGVLERRGHTEAAVDLATRAGLAPAGLLAELTHDDGTMMRGPACEAFARDHGLAFLRIDDLVAYRRCTEAIVEPVAEARLPTRHGPFVVRVFRDLVEGREHIALIRGEVADDEPVLVRVHSECLTGDLFGSLRCDCGAQLDAALARVAREGRGVVVYLRGHEGRGIGLINKLHAYKLQDEGRDTVEANLDLGLPVDSRRYDVGAQILTALGITTIRLMSNNPAKFAALDGYPLRVVERVPLLTAPNAENARYLSTKRHKLGHLLDAAQAVQPARGSCDQN
ncbi:MAG TPA: bifunctional 3,4-dihydroxy-2-butanone-4-phosphate synthase/GTP cyclohydrolase II [Polyangiaceae bacterium]|nr:bifunctional 3,4-dihydroxy-2-butanone-4-phosphate synthase/GTP cyclohydrolase II [Polyangiaceae bacterium]